MTRNLPLLLLGVALATLCYVGERVAPGSLWATTPLCLAGYALIAIVGGEERP